MRKLLASVCLLVLSASPCWAAGLSLTIHNGTVTLDAQDVTLRQILSEWARVGKTRIVNVDAVTSPPMTIKLEGVPEQTALDILLRTIPGYMAAPRAAAATDASIYDRILIMATTTPVAARPQTAAFQGTQLRAAPLPQNAGFAPGVMPDPAAEQQDDRVIAAAAAAGLIPPQPQTPGSSPFPAGAYPAGAMQPANPATPFAPVTVGPPLTTQAPLPATPPVTSNPWNVPMGVTRPGAEPPAAVPAPAPAPQQPIRPRPQP